MHDLLNTLPKAKLKWIKNVMRFKITIKALRHSTGFMNIVESGSSTYFVTMTPTAVAPHLEGYRHLL